MIIENPDAFKSWLTSILEPLCDADPAALAKYVYALVKKDKPLEELRDGMLDQLDVFLQQETKPFVEMLFKSLETHDYLKPVPVSAELPNPSPPPEEHVEQEKEPEAENHVPVPPPPVVEKPPLRRSPPHRVVVPRVRPHPHHEQTLIKVLPTELLEEPVEAPRRRDRRNDSVSILARDKEDRRRRRSRSWERRARRRRPSRSPSPRGRYRNRSPPVADRHPSRSRSRSPVPVRERELERDRDRMRPLREMERDRMSRDREHRDRISHSRDRERSRDRSMSPHDTRLEHADVYKRRCRDFDVKGYCMRGDLCEWDHGADPVVLEDAALTRVLAGPPALAEYNPAAPDIWSGGVVGAFPPPPPAHHLAPRELVPIPRVRHEPPLGAAMPPPPRHPPPPKKNFDYNRLGPSRPPFPSNANCSLEVKKVPRGLNDITHLNNHFCKFGKIVNIQVCYEGDQEAALITFSTPTEANVAYKSTEAVLNNRFIKVFWHNPENKQENTAPGGHPANKQTERQNSHPMSHNKVLINRDNIKATADSKQNAEKQAKEAREASNGTGGRGAVDMHRRAQALLHTQLRQQTLLIQKLESGNVTEQQKAALMEAINAAQEGIEKLRKELVAYNGMIKQMQEETVARSMSRLQLQVNAKKPKTAQEAQKEILDAELDIITKQQEGRDVSELALRIAALRRAAAALTHTRGHRGGRFNPAMRYSRGGHGKGFSVNQSVDHRPRALLVSGFEPDELDALQAHFAQFGEITGKEVNLSVPELVVQYRARQHAEHALHAARNYSDRTLSITWVTNNKPLPAPAVNGDAAHDADDAPRPTRLDEDDEDEEHRSWRR